MDRNGNCNINQAQEQEEQIKVEHLPSSGTRATLSKLTDKNGYCNIYQAKGEEWK